MDTENINAERNHNKKRKILSRLCWLFIAVFLISGCSSDGKRVVITTGFARDEVFRIEDESCKLNEIMVYLTTVQNQYENVYGEQIWNARLDGVTLEQNVKDTVLARIAQVKTMYLLAKERGVELDEDEEALVDRAGKEFFHSLSQVEVETLAVTEQSIKKMYRQYAMADKVYREIIADVNPEISDDEARIVKAEMIFFSTNMRDGSGKRVDYSEKEKDTVYQHAVMVKEIADIGERTFEDLAAQYSDNTEITFSIGKDEIEKKLEDAVFNLSNGEISDVIEGENGYYLIKCISTFDREETDANKLILVEKRKEEAFGAEYDTFVQGLVRNLNVELWDSVEMIRNPEVCTSDFFEIYSQYFTFS